MTTLVITSVSLFFLLFAGICFKHRQNYNNETGCPDCNGAKAEKKYRKMGRSVLVDQSVVSYKPMRQDARNSAMLCQNEKER